MPKGLGFNTRSDFLREMMALEDQQDHRNRVGNLVWRSARYSDQRVV